jgi:hypothetical protein
VLEVTFNTFTTEYNGHALATLQSNHETWRYRRWNVVVVETDQYQYQWQEQGRKLIILNVNEDVHFYRDGNWFIVRDSNNKKHKFALTSSTRK